MSDTDDAADGIAVVTAGLLVLEASLMMLEAHRESRRSLNAERDESVASDPSVNLVEVYQRCLSVRVVLLTTSMTEQNFPTTRVPRYDAHAPPISLSYLRSPLRPFGMPFLGFSSTHRDAVARALESSRSPRSPAGSEFEDGSSSSVGGSVCSTGSAVSGGDDETTIFGAALTASLAREGFRLGAHKETTG
jgi:hypothetical protein